MTVHRRMWMLTIINLGMAMFAIKRGDDGGYFVGALLLALTVLTATLAFRARARAR